ncbi:radical SAM protein [Streptomyces sp. NPDC056465]|uniref:radical SAM protein n=1 Tax=Streptomyces sp. NPDC056465 TaxID=3345829 RepID=UPI0036A4CAA2
MTTIHEMTAPQAPTGLPAFLELEITGRCQLACSHCYAESGPTQGHGSMTVDDWKRILDEAGAGETKTVQFIGGEPTMHPAFAELVRHALDVGLRVRVYSNLYLVRDAHWPLFSDPRVDLATSYYSDDPAEHDAITSRKGSHTSTRANIVEAVRRGISVKVGIIHMRDGQRSQEALAEMQSIGVAQVGIDNVRAVGNAATDKRLLPSTSELCGRCADGKAAVLPDGTVAPCVMARFLPGGDVKGGTLASVMGSDQWAKVAASIPSYKEGCLPDEDSCQPAPFAPAAATACKPNSDGSDCSPAEKPACNPKY